MITLKEELKFKEMVATLFEKCEDEGGVSYLEDILTEIIEDEAERRYDEIEYEEDEDEDWEDDEEDELND